MPTPNTALDQTMEKAVAHFHAGRLDEAETLCRQVLVQRSNDHDALHLMGRIAFAAGRTQVAAELMGRAVAANPSNASAYYSLGKVLLAANRVEEVISCFQQCLRLNPQQAVVQNELGITYGRAGRLMESIEAFRECVRLNPAHADSHSNLGKAFMETGRLNESIAACRKCLEINPQHLNACVILGTALFREGCIDDAVAAYEQALRLDSSHAEAHNNLANCYKEQGRLQESIASSRRAVELRPDWVAAHSNLLLTLHYDGAFDARALYDEHLVWQRRHADPLKKEIRPHRNSRKSSRTLRIGYVSGDFCRHPVARFLLPLLEHHDRRQFAISCYSNVAHPDELTNEVRARTDVWRNIYPLHDEAAAEMIRKDGIDILVDLSAHTAHNRLLLFARKPAPVQATYLAYCSTTGLEAMDFRITDRYLDAPDSDGAFYTEKSIWLPETYWCYSAPPDAPPVNESPVRKAGCATFGCLNSRAKVTPAALKLWSRLLHIVPDSRLVLHAHPGKHRQGILNVFAGEGISRERVEFVGRLPLATHLATYQRIDIGLDPFPFGGGTTTCDSLWMGVPVVSLAGKTAVSRAGLSILSNCGVPEFAATSEEEYLKIAANLASDPSRLGGVRATLRAKMQASPLMNAAAFARGMENAYRQMWRQ